MAPKIIVAIVAIIFIPIFILYVKSEYPKRRKYMYILTIYMVLVQVTMIAYLKFRDRGTENLKPELQIQIDKLNDMSTSLDNLQNFIKDQKIKLQEAETRINDLTKEKERLEPLVDADKKVIETLFSLQEERNKSKVWLDRFIGAFFGIISSLIAAMIYKLISTRIKT